MNSFLRWFWKIFPQRRTNSSVLWEQEPLPRTPNPSFGIEEEEEEPYTIGCPTQPLPAMKVGPETNVNMAIWDTMQIFVPKDEIGIYLLLIPAEDVASEKQSVDYPTLALRTESDLARCIFRLQQALLDMRVRSMEKPSKSSSCQIITGNPDAVMFCSHSMSQKDYANDECSGDDFEDEDEDDGYYW